MTDGACAACSRDAAGTGLDVHVGVGIGCAQCNAHHLVVSALLSFKQSFRFSGAITPRLCWKRISRQEHQSSGWRRPSVQISVELDRAK